MSSAKPAFAIASHEVPLLSARDPKALSLGDTAVIWHGDDLPHREGGAPPGYVGKTYMTQWLRGTHNAGYMSFGPYYQPSTVGSLLQVRFIMSLSNRGGNDEDVLTADIVDHNNGGSALLPARTLRVRDFPVGSDGFIIFSTQEVSIAPAMSIETRITAHGGASLNLYQIRYDIHYL